MKFAHSLFLSFTFFKAALEPAVDEKPQSYENPSKA
jgi:hypothetical protein